MTPPCRQTRSPVPLAGLLALLVAVQGGSAAANPPRTPAAVVMSEDASRVAAEVQGRAFVWDRSSGKRLASFKVDQFFRGAVTKGALVLIGEDSVKVRRGPRYSRVVKLKTPKTISMGRTCISANGKVAAAYYPKDGGAGDPDTTVVWDAVSGAIRATLPLGRGRVQGAVLSRDGRLLAVYGDEPGKKALLRVYRLGKRGAKAFIRWDSARHRTTYSAAFSPDGRLLALGAGQQLLLWDIKRRRVARSAATDAIKALFPAPLRRYVTDMPGAHQLAFSADGAQLAALHGFKVVGVSRWSVADLKPRAWLKRPRAGGTMRHLAWDPRGKLHLISASYSTNIWLHAPKGDRFTTTRVLSGTK